MHSLPDSPKHRPGIPANAIAVLSAVLLACTGCALAPDVRQRERFHNPLPQLHRIAIIPFYNQSTEPTLDELQVAEAYYAELQAIPGFEVLPIGVSTLKWREYQRYPGVQVNGSDQVTTSTFQQFAQFLGVDAVVVGAVTDYTPYSPPRFALTTRWYAANPSFHPVPVGYGLPWGTKAEKQIPRRILLETELEVARAQLATQTPQMQSSQPEQPISTGKGESRVVNAVGNGNAGRVAAREPVFDSGVSGDGRLPPSMKGPDMLAVDATNPPSSSDASPVEEPLLGSDAAYAGDPQPAITSGMGPMAGQTIDPETGAPVVPLPENWPDPSRLIPASPNPNGPPEPLPQSGPVLTHTRIYRGDDPDVTNKLADYVYARDDGRLGGWQGYLTRSDDFIRFCCYLHITEMLEMRGGRDQSDLIFRWPISRYWR